MSFPITTLIALVAYFISRAALTSSKQVYIGLFLALILVTSLMISSKGLSILALHVSVTSFSIVILMVTFFETTLLERHITKIKKGEIGSNTKSVEDQESTGISASYTMGGMTLAGAMNETDNMNGSSTAANDVEGYEFTLSFAF